MNQYIAIPIISIHENFSNNRLRSVVSNALRKILKIFYEFRFIQLQQLVYWNFNQG